MGGEGSGRPPNPETLIKRGQPIYENSGRAVMFPNYGGLKDFAKKIKTDKVNISNDTNLAVTSPITLTNDIIGLSGTSIISLTSPLSMDSGIVSISGTTILSVNSPASLNNGVLSISGAGVLSTSSPVSFDKGNISISGSTIISGISPIQVDKGDISHLNSGVTAGTYRSLTTDALGHITAGSNPIWDISADTNLAVTSPATLTNDTIGVSGSTILAVTSPVSVQSGNISISGSTILAVTSPVSVQAGNISISGSTILAVTSPVSVQAGNISISGSTILAATSPVSVDNGNISISGTTVLSATYPTQLSSGVLSLITQLDNRSSFKFANNNMQVRAENLKSAFNDDNAGTINMWVKPDDVTPAAAEAFITFANTAADTRFSFHLQPTGELRGLMRRSGVADWTLDTQTSALTQGQWHMISITHDGITPRIYIDGVLAPTQNFSVSTNKAIWGNDMAINIASLGCLMYNANTTLFYDGYLDDVTLWNVELSASQLATIFNAAAKYDYLEDISGANVEAWHRMGDGDFISGAAAVGKIWHFRDWSGNENYSYSISGASILSVEADVP